jgi:hypothetical protein
MHVGTKQKCRSCEGKNVGQCIEQRLSRGVKKLKQREDVTLKQESAGPDML